MFQSLFRVPLHCDTAKMGMAGHKMIHVKSVLNFHSF